jgi:hypothetical protein
MYVVTIDNHKDNDARYLHSLQVFSKVHSYRYIIYEFSFLLRDWLVILFITI